MFVPLYVIWWKIFVDLFRYNEDYLLAILIIILA